MSNMDGYEILKYIEWDYGREYASITDKIDECETLNCESCNEPCKCIKKTNNTYKCISESRLLEFSVNKVITHNQNELTFIAHFNDQILKRFYYNGYPYKIYIFKDDKNKIYYVLFISGEDFEYDLDNETDYKELKTINDFITQNCTEQEFKIHLYGHSMGSSMIRYLLAYVNKNKLAYVNKNKLEFKKFVIKLSGVRINKTINDEELYINTLDLFSLNLGIQIEHNGQKYIFIDRLFNEKISFPHENFTIGIYKTDGTFIEYKKLNDIKKTTTIIVFDNSINNVDTIESTLHRLSSIYKNNSSAKIE